VKSEKKKVLFLDRDGVINVRLIADYVKTLSEFEFLPGVLNAISKFSKEFDRIFIVTNQQGVGKGLMSEEDLTVIHRKMIDDIYDADGSVDSIFYCPHLKNTGCTCRKPNRGMYEKAVDMFPEVEGSDLYMAGDTMSDMAFGTNIGAVRVMIDVSKKLPSKDYDFVYSSLEELSEDIEKVLCYNQNRGK